MDLAELPLTEARDSLLRGVMTASEYAEALIERTAGSEALGAYADFDADALRRAAAAADRRGVPRDAETPLGGIPIALKDNIDTASLTTSGGTGALQGRRASADAPLARRLFAAGALLAGKTNMHELAYGISTNNQLTGATRNPWNSRMSAGGSSGGSAAAVAARLVPGAVGTDTICSVRHPAALCGIAGFRPTVGRYPMQGVIPISHTRDTAGPMARCVADLRLLDGIMAGTHGAAPGAGLQGLRLGLVQDFLDGLDSQVAFVVEAAIERLSSAGVVFVDVEIERLADRVAASGFPIALFETMVDIPAWLEEHMPGLTVQGLVEGIGGADVRGYIAPLLGEGAIPRGVYDAAMAARADLMRAYDACFTANGVEALVLPTTPLPPARSKTRRRLS